MGAQWELYEQAYTGGKLWVEVEVTAAAAAAWVTSMYFRELLISHRSLPKR